MNDEPQVEASTLDHFRKTYFEECVERLDAAYAQLADLCEERGDAETLHAIFRAVHSIKGGGGAFGFARLVAFAHELETVLDRLRDGRLRPTADVTALLVRATDALSDLVEAARAGDEGAGAGFEDELIQALRETAEGAESGRAAPVASPAAPPEPVHEKPVEAGHPSNAHYRIRFLPRPEMFQRANEPLLLVRALRQLGRVSVEADLARLPDLAALEPEHAYLGWSFQVTTAAPRSAVEEIFEFVVDDCELVIDVVGVPEAGAPASQALPPILSPILPEPAAASPAGSPTAPAQDTDCPATDAGQGRPADGSGRSAARAPVAGAVQSIRVDVDKVDRVVNLVGELVINQAMLMQLGSTLPTDLCSGLTNGLETLSQQLRDLQESVMAIRAQPVKSVFARMPRLVREVAAQLGREVRLVVTGEATEIDKTVIEQLADPLTHLLRNALDHGIEPPEEREAQGKPRQGTVHLAAEHRSGRIVIEVTDDGRGIDRAKVLAKARARGIVAPGQALSDEEIDSLIFLPSFSTADAVSSISGRGVGMDVVKRNIQALGGRIAVQSRLGSGSRFTLSLPLTLAVLDGMVIGVGRETYIVPLTNIVESLRPVPADIHPLVGRGDVLAIRGDYVPLVHLHRRFAVPGAVTDPCQGIVVIVDSEGDGRIGLVADELLGQQQVVVKSLESNFGPVDGISAATILGTGRVALILDISRLQGSRGTGCAGREERPAAPAPAGSCDTLH